MSVDIYPADDIVEVALGEHRISGDTLRLVVDHPDTCLRLAEALQDARARLIEHRRAKTSPDSELDRVLPIPITS